MICSPDASQKNQPGSPSANTGVSNLERDSEERVRSSGQQLVRGNQPQEVASSADRDEETFIAKIRASDVSVGLRRIPAGFYVAVRHSDREWRTENKPVTTTNDAIEWHESIPIPSGVSATLCIDIYASFELQPMLGDGEQLRKMTITVEQLLSRSESLLPFTFFPKDGDIVSPCSSIFLAVRRQNHKATDLLDSRLLEPRRSLAESLGQLEEATNQGHGALSRYRKHSRGWDLERSAQQFEYALGICPLGHPGRAAAQSNLAMAKFIHSRVAGTIPSFDVPLNLYRQALDARPVGHPDRYATLVHLAIVHFACFEKQRDPFDAARAEALLREAVDLSFAESDRKRAAVLLLQLQAFGAVQENGQSSAKRDDPASDLAVDELSHASMQLVERFERFGDLADLQQAVSLLEAALRSTSLWDRQYLIRLTNLGAVLAHRFERLGDMRDLERSISKYREAVDLSLDNDSHKPSRLSYLGAAFLLRFLRLGELEDLDEAVSRLRDAHLYPVVEYDCLNYLGLCLLTRFERFGELEDLEEAISRLRDAVDVLPDNHPRKPLCLQNLGRAIFARSQCLGDPSDLERAISKYSDAVDQTPDGHISKPGQLSNLGSAILLRFERLGDLSDLDEAIIRFTDAVKLTPDGHLHKSSRLANLGSSLLARFRHFGELFDLEEGISKLGGAVDLIPVGCPERHAILNNLAVAFQHRFERLRERMDIEQAISILHDVVCLIPDDHSAKPSSLNNLGESLRIRFTYFGVLSDVEQSISRLMHAIDLTPDGHPNKPSYLLNLGNTLYARFQHLQQPSDLEQTISRYMDAVALIPDGHPDKPAFLNNLGDSLQVRFTHCGELDDLEQSISRLRDALHLTPDGHPNKPSYLMNLGSSFMARFRCHRELGDLERAISAYSHSACASTGPTTVRFQASRKWISCAHSVNHPSLLDAYSVAVGLLPQLGWIGFSFMDRYRELMRGVDIAREAAAAALDAGYPETSVEWLEQGRSIVWAELFQLRNSHEELSSVYPDHACRLRELSTALEHVGVAREKSLSTMLEQIQIQNRATGLSLEEEATRHRMLAISRDRLLQEIRRLPGFERFLLHKEFPQLRASARSGPVVILNAARTRCDALIILAEVNHVIHVPLPNFTLERTKGLQNMLRSLLGPARSVMPDGNREGKRATRECISWDFVLSSLWDGIVKPVLDALGFSTPGDLLRIFWCPTGPFASLPIHAAGLYGAQSSSVFGQKLSDFVVSSYIPTLSILTHSTTPNVAPGKILRVLAVRQPSSDGQMSLSGVDTEMKHIKAVVQSFPSARTTLVESSVGTVEEVLSLMKDADWVHFACHGVQDTDMPINSGLCLADRRRLKLSDIISISRPHGGLAFLSACQTATGDKDLSDEAVHIAAGMLFAGYGGVIGTMWSISDRLAPLVAKNVYQQLFQSGARPDYREAARALHDAVQRLRESNASFVEWIPFIHVGL